DHSVAARGQLTAAQAGVVLVGVAVVALLARVLDPVTAHARLADLGDAAQAVVAVRIAVAPAALGPERAVAVAIAVTRLAVAVTRLAVTVTRIAVTITAGPGRARIHAVAVDALEPFRAKLSADALLGTGRGRVVGARRGSQKHQTERERAPPRELLNHHRITFGGGISPG